ncbi:MAG TPA: antibiotic biosynthesis monooxygenase [Gemmatimonadales bacterium]|nr:antibiotic biosynthesis monooxygenase [Gemmatimonadales bacterium]
MTAHVTWILDMRVADGQLDALTRLMNEMSASTEKHEPGTLAYEWSLSADGTTCHLYERYADSAAAMLHIATFGEKYATRFMDLLTPTRFLLYGSPDASVRNALAAFGPTYMAPAAGFFR